MEDVYKEAYSEISEIIKLMPRTMVSKIPVEVIDAIENEKSNTYVPNITLPIEDCNIKEETKAILYLIYRDFLNDEDNKRKLQIRDARKIEEVEEIIKKNNNLNTIF